MHVNWVIKKHQECIRIMYYGVMRSMFDLRLDRAGKTSLSDQIQNGIRAAIMSGALAPGARLPSWQDLAAQLGVARGTVRVAYEKLSAAQLIIASRATGTLVAKQPRTSPGSEQPPDPGSFMELYREMTQGPAFFQMGVPARDVFPATLFARIRAQAVRNEAAAPLIYADPRGELELRREIAGYLAVARGIDCTPAQIIITGGYANGLGLALRVLRLEGQKVWMEDPGFPFTRRGLELADLSPVPIPVDDDGLDVEHGLRIAPDARLAVVTPGQQAPLGVTLSLDRRLALLDWAARRDAWIIEDDYLGELQLEGRAAPALASLDRDGRVIHIGSFSKTIGPTLRLGFLVAPPSLLPRFGEVAACLAPPPGPSVQLAMAEFLREGHYIRHLRRTKRAYSAQRDALLACLPNKDEERTVTVAGLAVLLRFAGDIPDMRVVREALAFAMSPAPLSAWWASPAARQSGLLLGIATVPGKDLPKACDRLLELVARFR